MIMTSACSRSKGQSAMEFMFIFGIFIAAFLIAMLVALPKMTEVSDYSMKLETQRVLSRAAGKINTAWIEGEGYTTNMTLPETIGPKNYTLNVTSNHLLLFIESGHYSETVITNNVTGSFSPGTNTLTNMGDRIVIS